MKTTDVCSQEKEWGCAEKGRGGREREGGGGEVEREKRNETDDSDGKNK